MPYTRSSRGFRSRGTRGSFRSRGSTFRGRGRGSSDAYYESSRGSYSSGRGSFRGTSNYRGRDDSYESRDSSNRYSGDRYSGSHNRREDSGNHHHREIRESASGSFGRSHSRHEGEPERKRIRSEIGSSYKEGVSPRRSYDDLDHSNRSYSSSTGSPYRSSESSSFAKSHHHRPKEYSEFKKPLPPAQESSYSGSSSRGSRGRGIVRSVTGGRISRSTVPSFLRRSAVGRISRLRPTTSSMQLLLRRKKLLRLQRMRKANEARGRISKNEKVEENTINTSEDEELETLDAEEEELEAEELDQSITQSEGSGKVESSSGEDGKSEAKKSAVGKKTKAEPSESGSPTKAKKAERPPMSSFHKDHITLKCVHCKIECATFKTYLMHLTSYRHKNSMDSLMYDLKQKLRRMRAEQRDQQRVIDEQNDDFAKTLYCRVCKLNYKQSKQEHFTSDHHITLNEFLNPKCSVCRMNFATRILYEHHKCTLNHIKRKAFLEKKGVDVKDADNEEENNDEDNFMVLDSVGSADEDEGDETPANTSAANDTEAEPPKAVAAKKKKLPKVIGAEFIKRVPVYYCKLCRLCLPYNPNTNQEDLLLGHCRGRFHLKRYSVEKMKKTKEESAKLKKAKLNKSSASEKASQNGTADANDSAEVNESSWDEGGENQKSSDEEEEEASNRYDRFGHSEEMEKASATVKTEPTEENEANEKVTSQA